ncbi:MAG: glycosyltransferase [Candidatus Competibacteraceae bacterium]|nr:glycosyltransferase [Candidatus Competibacteraceae bacterium]
MPDNPVDRPIRVLHLIHTMAYGGVETALINWLARIDRRQFEIHLVCFANPGATERPFVEAAARAEVPVVARLPWHRGKPVIRAARRLKELIQQWDIDVLHTHNCYADCVGAVTRWLTPVRTITTLYVWSDLGWKRNLIQWVNRVAIRSYDLISAHCDETYDKTLAMGFPRERLRTLFCGFEMQTVELDPEQRRRRRREAGIADDQILLANIARLYPEKAQDVLLRCFKRIHQAHPEVRLWILGVGPLEQQLRDYCHRLGLDELVTFTGFVDDLPALLPLLDIQLHPTWIEGVPLSICSGMAAGLPIVANDVGGIPEVLRHDRSALLVPPGDEAGFVAAVNRLIDNPEQSRRLGQAARHFIENDYSLNTAVARVEQTYREVLAL